MIDKLIASKHGDYVGFKCFQSCFFPNWIQPQGVLHPIMIIDFLKLLSLTSASVTKSTVRVTLFFTHIYQNVKENNDDDDDNRHTYTVHFSSISWIRILE